MANVSIGDVSAPAGLNAGAREATAISMFEDHYKDVFRYVRARVGSPAEAEDLTGDVFCKAVAGLTSYRPLRVSPLPWLYTIAAHRVADHYRAVRPLTAGLDAAEEVVDQSPNPSEVVVTRDTVGRVWSLARNLPPAQARALWLRYGEELDLKEIAERMGRSVEAVKLLVHRAVRGLRAAVAAEAAPAAPAAPVLSLVPAGPSVSLRRQRRGRSAVAA